MVKLVIDNAAKQSLQEAYLYIKKDSLQNAEKVKSETLASIRELLKNPELHAPDKYRLNNNCFYNFSEDNYIALIKKALQ